ncbi:MAG: hypothetical protein KBT36_13910 [Kurthia sp.]|nr:hypothetical protein [Candidatus Kurthia equi]
MKYSRFSELPSSNSEVFIHNESNYNKSVDFQNYKRMLALDIKHNDLTAPTGISFRANQQMITDNNPTNKIVSWIMRSQLNENATLVNLEEVDIFATSLANAVYKFKNKIYKHLLYFLHICLDELGAVKEHLSLEVVCDYDPVKKDFNDRVFVEIKFRKPDHVKDATMYTHIFSKIANSLITDFSPTTAAKVTTLHKDTGLYQYVLNFSLSLFIFKKRAKLRNLETPLFKFENDRFKYFDGTVKQWIRKLRAAQNRQGTNLKIYFEVDRDNRNELYENDTQSQFIHNSEVIDGEIFKNAFYNTIKKSSEYEIENKR